MSRAPHIAQDSDEHEADRPSLPSRRGRLLLAVNGAVAVTSRIVGDDASAHIGDDLTLLALVTQPFATATKNKKLRTMPLGL